MKKLTVFVLSLAMLTAFAGCKGPASDENGTQPSVVPTATATVQPQKTSTASSPAPSSAGASSSNKSGSDISIKAGTWLSSIQGLSTSYYFFNSDGKTGSTASLENGTGLSFNYKISGSDAIFYMGAADNESRAVLSQNAGGDIVITWSTGEKETLTYVSAQGSDKFSFYSNDELCTMAVNYYTKTTGEAPPSAAAVTNEDGSVTIQLYKNLGDHNSTYAWYTVDRNTAAGIDESSGKKIDLK